MCRKRNNEHLPNERGSNRARGRPARASEHGAAHVAALGARFCTTLNDGGETLVPQEQVVRRPPRPLAPRSHAAAVPAYEGGG